MYYQEEMLNEYTSEQLPILENRIKVFHSISKDRAPDDFRTTVLDFNKAIERKKFTDFKSKKAALIVKGKRIVFDKDMKSQANKLAKDLDNVFISCGMKPSKKSIEIDPEHKHGNIFYKISKDKQYIYVGYYEVPYEIRAGEDSSLKRRAINIAKSFGPFVILGGLRSAKKQAERVVKIGKKLNTTVELITNPSGGIDLDLEKTLQSMFGIIVGIAGFSKIVELVLAIKGVIYFTPIFYIECIENNDVYKNILGI